MPTTYVFPRQCPLVQLWPVHQADRTMLTPSAFTNAANEYGQLGDGVDKGCLRQLDDGTLEIAWAGVWVKLSTVTRGAETAYRSYARYGAGWSYPKGDVHALRKDRYEKLTAHDATRWPPLPSVDDEPFAGAGDRVLDDVLFDAGFAAQVDADYTAVFPPTTTPETPPMPPTPPVPPITPPTPPVKPTPDLPPQPPVVPPVQPPTPARPALSAEGRATIAKLRDKVANGKPGKGGRTILIGNDFRPKLDALLTELDKL